MHSSDDSLHIEKRKFKLHEHPWLSMLAVILTSLFSIALTGTILYGVMGFPDDQPVIQFSQAMAFHLLTGFVLVPFVLRLPKGKRAYRQYLADIGLTRFQPFGRLLVLALSCYLILALSQAAVSFIYRLLEGLPVSETFARGVFNLSRDLPPRSSSLLLTFPSIFEEVGFRGVVLTVFLSRYSERKAIVLSSLGFGLMHLLNLGMGRETVWVLGQVVWAAFIGFFYGYIFVRTRSLWPSMIVHFLSNAFIGSLTGYMQDRASAAVQVVYGVTLSLGIVPVVLMILWVRYFTARWLPAPEPR